MSESVTTTVDLVIRIEVVGAPTDVENCRGALDCLADVMAVQAEDGLWSLGHEDAENDDGPSEIVANITSTKVHAVLIGGAPHEAALEQIRSTLREYLALETEYEPIAGGWGHLQLRGAARGAWLKRAGARLGELRAQLSTFAGTKETP